MERTKDDERTAWKPGMHLFCNEQCFLDYIGSHGGKQAANLARQARREANAIIKKMIG